MAGATTDTLHQRPGGGYCTWTIRGGMVHAFVAKPRRDWAALEAGTAGSSADPLAPLKAAEPDEITEEDWAKAVVVGGDRVSAADARCRSSASAAPSSASGRADLNGRRGTARRWNAAKERLEFSLDKSDAGQKVILVRPVNLQRLEGDSPAGGGRRARGGGVRRGGALRHVPALPRRDRRQVGGRVRRTCRRGGLAAKHGAGARRRGLAISPGRRLEVVNVIRMLRRSAPTRPPPVASL